MDPAGVDYGEFGAACFGGELRVGEGGGVGLLFHFSLKALDVVETEDLAATHEVDDIAGGTVDGVYADEVALAVNADGVEAVVVYGFHEVQGVVGIAEWPAFIVGEDGGDVVDLRGREVRARIFLRCGEKEDRERGDQDHGTSIFRCVGMVSRRFSYCVWTWG